VTRLLQRGEHALIGDIIGDSFADDPVNTWVLHNRRCIAAYYTLMARKLYLARGFGHVMGDDGGTLWLPPGVSKDLPLWRSLDIGATLIRHCGPGALARGFTVDAALKRSRPQQPHYYLFAIGVRPGRQGKGTGGRLLTAGLERVDAERKPAYLESSKADNLPFYRRFGFELVEEVSPSPGCPPLWPMWREAR
jgi:GNAT superfamily N-acetyltransferase